MTARHGRAGIRRSLLPGFLALLMAACSRPLVPDLGGIYDAAAMDTSEPRQPVVVIPGILGSRLVDGPSGRIVWGAFAGDYADPRRDEGARLVALPMRPGAPLADLEDGTVPDGALDRVQLRVFGLPVVLNAYRTILGVLGVGGYADESLGASGAVDYGSDHYTCFQFDYDWRRDVSENAVRLHEFLLEKEVFVREKRAERFSQADAPVRFDVVAHSMGGLLVRYYLRYGPQPLADDGTAPRLTWEGADRIARTIMIGTPNAGSIRALDELVGGVKLGPFTPRYQPAILGTMPSIYQLLPRARHGVLVREGAEDVPLDPYDADLWERMGWGLAAEDQDGVLAKLLPELSDAANRRAVALDHQRKCLARARQLAHALDVPAEPPEGTELFLIAGDAVSTPRTARIDERGKLAFAEFGPGDGTVLRSSALMDERSAQNWQPRLVSPVAWEHVHFIFRDHLGLTKDPAFTDNVLYILLEDPR